MKRIGKQFISLIRVFGMIIAGTGKESFVVEQDNHLKTTDLLVYLDETPILLYSI